MAVAILGPAPSASATPAPAQTGQPLTAFVEAFTGDTLALATFTGTDDTGAPRTLVLQLRRK